VTREEIAHCLNWLCRRWLNRRHARRTGRDALHRESFISTYHEDRNCDAARSRLRRYQENRGAL
jgi:hypothetical protein